MAVNRLTPLGGRQYGVSSMEYLLPAVHFLGLLLLWLVVPVMVARWRLGRRMRVFRFPKTARLNWLVVLCAAAFIPASGWLVVSGFVADAFQLWQDDSAGKTMAFRPILSVCAVLLTLGASLGWVLWQAASALFSRPERLLFRATSSLVLIRVYLTVMLLLVFAGFGFKGRSSIGLTAICCGKWMRTSPLGAI